MSKLNIKDIKIDINSLHLYKFVNADKKALKSFKNNLFYATNPSAFNDPYDSLTTFNKSKIEDYINKKASLFLTYCAQNNIPSCSQDELFSYVYNLIKPDASFMNKDFYLSCLSSSIDQGIMWAHYADSSKGLVLEYDPLDLIYLYQLHTANIVNAFLGNTCDNDAGSLNESVGSGIIKVIYKKHKLNITDLYIKMVDLCFDKMHNNKKALVNNVELIHITIEAMFQLYGIDNIFDVVKTTFGIKNKEWSYENEYRLPFLVSQPSLKSKPRLIIGKVKPIAIYLGERINNKNKAKFIKIARRKKIKVYQMELNNNGKYFSLIPVLLFDFTK